MKIATFNIYNVNRRLPNLLAWLSAKLRYLNLGRPPAVNVVPMRKHATK